MDRHALSALLTRFSFVQDMLLQKMSYLEERRMLMKKIVQTCVDTIMESIPSLQCGNFFYAY